MPTTIPSSISEIVHELAAAAGLSVASVDSGKDFNGAPTAKVQLRATTGALYPLELSESFAANAGRRAELSGELGEYLRVLAQRMRAPRPDVFLTLHGLPISLQQFSWPYHRSTSGADSFILHGVAQLAEPESALHAKVAASLTVTFAEVLPALEQPFAEAVTFNAVRKTLDLTQLEMLKSGNRQPVPVSTRYYSFREKRFIFSETNDAKRKDFIRTKVFWISARLGGNSGAWIADPYDTQYLDCSADNLRKAAQELEKEGLVHLDSTGDFAAATEKLASQADEFSARMQATLASLKPKFNEEMRAGHTNM